MLYSVQIYGGIKMRISTKGRYALRMMLDLALHDPGTPVRIKEIAARQEISDKYLEQIVAVLNKAGYVRSVRGPQGGYLLTRPAGEYTVGMILRLTEGSLAPVECLDSEVGGCEKSDDCVTVLVYRKMNEAVNDVIDHITLADLMGWKLQKDGDYSI